MTLTLLNSSIQNLTQHYQQQGTFLPLSISHFPYLNMTYFMIVTNKSQGTSSSNKAGMHLSLRQHTLALCYVQPNLRTHVRNRNYFPTIADDEETIMANSLMLDYFLHDYPQFTYLRLH